MTTITLGRAYRTLEGHAVEIRGIEPDHVGHRYPVYGFLPGGIPHRWMLDGTAESYHNNDLVDCGELPLLQEVQAHGT